MPHEIFIILFLIIANGVFAMSELAIVSAKKIRLQQRSEAGSKGATIALELANNPDRLLSTVQIGITLIGIIAGVYGGATLAEDMAMWLETFNWIRPYHTSLAYIVVVGSITYLSLIIGELVPKRLALHHAERIACDTAWLMKGLSIIGAPLVWLLSVSTNTVLKVLRIDPTKDPIITDEEVNLIMEEGMHADIFEETEKDMVKKVLRLDDRQVSVVMTKRPDIVWYNTHESSDENWKRIITSNHLFFPVCNGELNSVIGVGSIRKIISHTAQPTEADIKAVLEEPMFVPMTISVLDVLEKFKSSRVHHALVIDEYGSIRGFVTLSDIAEAVLGDVSLPSHVSLTNITKQSDTSWLVTGDTLLDELNDTLPNFTIRKVPNDVHTLAGYILHFAEHIPQVGEQFTWRHWQFTITQLDGHQIKQVLLQRVV